MGRTNNPPEQKIRTALKNCDWSLTKALQKSSSGNLSSELVIDLIKIINDNLTYVLKKTKEIESEREKKAQEKDANVSS